LTQSKTSSAAMAMTVSRLCRILSQMGHALPHRKRHSRRSCAKSASVAHLHGRRNSPAALRARLPGQQLAFAKANLCSTPYHLRRKSIARCPLEGMAAKTESRLRSGRAAVTIELLPYGKNSRKPWLHARADQRRRDPRQVKLSPKLTFVPTDANHEPLPGFALSSVCGVRCSMAGLVFIGRAPKGRKHRRNSCLADAEGGIDRGEDPWPAALVNSTRKQHSFG